MEFMSPENRVAFKVKIQDTLGVSI
jgi:hypothetical protein